MDGGSGTRPEGLTTAQAEGPPPLVLKLNGKTVIPPGTDPVSGVNATVAGAVRLGADAVGYTLYVGSPAQQRDFEQYRQNREDAQRFGSP